jgi:hypothetical protein
VKHNRSTRLKLSPIQREILWTLDEAGDEYITTILNTLRKIFPNRSNDDLIMAVESAIYNLYKHNLITICRKISDRDLIWLPLSPEEIDTTFPITKFLSWDDIQSYWAWNEHLGGQYRISLVLTEKGKQALRK